MAEYYVGEELKKYIEKSLESYQKASEIAEKALPPTNPLRLGLALNYSVFQYEICDKRDQACSLAKKAFDDAIEKIEDLGEDQYKDSTTIMQLIRDNLTLWTSDMQDETEPLE